jgi:hypothetical protein
LFRQKYATEAIRTKDYIFNFMGGFKKYKIRKGSHYSGFRLAPFFGKTTSKYEVVFTKSCIYQIEGPGQFDVNKLFGLSYGFHHENSARFGWRAVDDLIEISLYCYKDGRRVIKEMTSIETEKPYVFEICNTGSHYELTIESVTGPFRGYAIVSKPQTTKLGYKLFPYFGGNLPAPHDVEILMKKLK